MSKRLLSFSHRAGPVVDLPLLVPSFSSKGFPFFRERSKGRRARTYSMTSNALETLGTYLNESMLVSAYDLHHGHFRSPETHFGTTSLIVVDSGGYELTPDFDSSEPKITEVRGLPFTESDYVSLLDKFCEKHHARPLVITNFDWASRNRPFDAQIKKARSLFDRYPHWSNNFILKPHSKTGKVLDLNALLPYLSELKSFDIIGVTEKELGKNLLDRLRFIARLRVELRRRDIDIPIHVWGGLDPVVTPLYFFAGADIFDGVSWLRYAFHQGVAVNREASTILAGDVTAFHDHAVALTLSRNLTVLQGLATSLRSFAINAAPTFGMFDYNGPVFEKAFRAMSARISELKEIY
jgi:hypothetical protein